MVRMAGAGSWATAGSTERTEVCTCCLTHGWASLLPGPVVYGAESDSSHKGSSHKGLWMDAKLLVVEGET